MNKFYFDENLNSYPLILIPSKILEIFERGVTNLEVCEDLNLDYPILQLISKPPKPKKYRIIERSKTKFQTGGNGCLLILGIPGFIFIFAMIIAGFQNDKPLVSVIFIVILILTLNQFGAKLKTETYFDNEKIVDEEYKLLMEKYTKTVDEIEEKNNIIKTKYDNDKERIDFIIKKNYSNILTKHLLNQLLPEVSFIELKNNQRRGKTEIYFLAKIFKEFPNEVSVNVVPNIGRKAFQPDFLIICKETGLHIDIEIDEPYSVDNGKPIHHNKSNDDERNGFFLELNWAVIRFTEKQIIENSEECVSLIRNILIAVKNKKNYVRHNIPLQKIWSYEEALVMSNNGYRNTYLPDNLKIKIKYKDLNNLFENDDLPF